MKDHKQPLQKQLPLIDNYFEHLTATLDWLLVSIEKGKGGSSAYFSPLLGWGSPYPETSGYIITTLLDASQLLNKEKYYNAACKVGDGTMVAVFGGKAGPVDISATFLLGVADMARSAAIWADDGAAACSSNNFRAGAACRRGPPRVHARRVHPAPPLF